MRSCARWPIAICCPASARSCTASWRAGWTPTHCSAVTGRHLRRRSPITGMRRAIVERRVARVGGCGDGRRTGLRSSRGAAPSAACLGAVRARATTGRRVDQLDLTERAAEAASAAGEAQLAIAVAERAVELADGERGPAARAAGAAVVGRRPRRRRARRVGSSARADAVGANARAARLLESHARLLLLTGHADEANAPIDEAIAIARGTRRAATSRRPRWPHESSPRATTPTRRSAPAERRSRQHSATVTRTR